MKSIDKIFIQTVDKRLYMLEFEYLSLEEENFLLKSALHEMPNYEQDSEYGCYPESVLRKMPEIEKKIDTIFNKEDSAGLMLLLRIHHLEFQD